MTKFVPKPPMVYTTAFKDNTLLTDDIWVGCAQPNADLEAERLFKFQNKDDVLEYAIHGWFRWIGMKSYTWQSLFRVTTSPENMAGDMNYEGDRTMAMMHGPAYINVANSHYGSTAGDNWNYIKNWEYDKYI